MDMASAIKSEDRNPITVAIYPNPIINKAILSLDEEHLLKMTTIKL